ncbi:MAG TPA: type IV secretion system protein, partial [Nitrospira sp.]|nr:type IV secretion system protein [Nitrospira sp.]
IPHYRDDILNPNNMTTTYGALDEAGHAVVWIAADFFRDTSISDIAGSILNILCGILFLVIGGLFIAVAAINVIIGEVGFALAMGIAPLALVALMIEQTKGHFQSWLQFALGFAILPLLAAALTSVVLFVAGQLLLIANAGSDNKAGYFPFLFIIIAALFLLFKLPEMASSLAGTSVMAASGRAPMAMASAVKNSAMKNAGRAMGAAKMAYRTGQRVRDGASVANSALKKGATKREAAWAAISGMRQSTMARQSRRDERLAKRMVGTAKNKAVPPAVAYKNDATNNSGS